jgi:hypothetical protein
LVREKLDAEGSGMTDSASDQDPLGPLADEFLQRHRRGERPDVTEYTRRHPERADEIRALLSALLVLEDVRPGPPAQEPERAGAEDVPSERLGGSTGWSGRSAGAAWASSTRRCRSRWAAAWP